MKLFWRDIQYGWASTNFFNAFMFGFLFLVLAIVCEYLAEIRGDVKNRPLYVVQDEFHSNTMVADAERRNVVSHEAMTVRGGGVPAKTTALMPL
jgi:hypothetical protein